MRTQKHVSRIQSLAGIRTHELCTLERRSRIEAAKLQRLSSQLRREIRRRKRQARAQ